MSVTNTYYQVVVQGIPAPIESMQHIQCNAQAVTTIRTQTYVDACQNTAV